MQKISKLSLCLLFTSVLAACGGGGGGGSTPSATLSADQSVFESLILTPNASYSPSWSLPSTGTPVNGTDTFYASPISLSASPLTSGAQSPTGGPDVSIANTLSVIPGSVTRFLVNGVIVNDANAFDRYTYSGSSVRRETLLPNSTTVLASELRSNYQSAALSGAVSASPTDFKHYFNVLFFNSSLLNSTATWGAGARYVTYTATTTNDRYRVFDFTSTVGGTTTGVTTGTNPTPLATGTTIAALMSAGGIMSGSDGVTYTLANGTVAIVNGVRTYTATVVRPSSTTDRFRTYYELGGDVYTGDLTKANTILGGSAYQETLGGVTTANYSSKIQLRVNKATVDSFHAAVTF